MSFLREWVNAVHLFLAPALNVDALPPDLSFEGQSVLITGGTSGLGFEAAIHYLQLGANVIITARTSAKGEQAKLEIEKRTGKVIQAMVLDMDTFEGVKKFMETLKTKVPSLDIVLLVSYLTQHCVHS
jgi:short-subunit dehydrogenase involved in D-alanine esterification of teichoic acids